MKIRELSNGVRVAMEPLPYLRSFSIGIWVGAGCFAESESNNGISHFIEHMLFKGTKKRSAREIAGCIDALGGQLNAFTAKECTCYYVNILNAHYGIAVDLLCDMILNCKLDDGDIEREKGVVCEEIAMVEDTPDELAHEKLSKAFYGEHPLGKTILGPAEAVRGLRAEDMRAYMGQTYVPRNIVVSVAGSFAEQEILDMLEEKLGRQMAPSTVFPARCGALQQPAGELLVLEKDIEQVNLCLALPGAAQTSDAYFAQNMISNIFGGGMSSRLFQRVREQNGMTYSIYSYLASAVNSGMFTIYAGMNPAQAPQVLDLILDEADKLKREGVTEKELVEAREQLKGSFVLGLESAAARMNRNGKVLLLNGNVLTVDEVIARINAVTKDDIDRNIQTMFDRTRLSAAAVGKCGGELIQMLQEIK